MPGGRPTKLTEECAARMIESVRGGSCRRDAAKGAGVSNAALCRWIARGRSGESGVHYTFINELEKAERIAEEEAYEQYRFRKEWKHERKIPQEGIFVGSICIELEKAGISHSINEWIKGNEADILLYTDPPTIIECKAKRDVNTIKTGLGQLLFHRYELPCAILILAMQGGIKEQFRDVLASYNIEIYKEGMFLNGWRKTHEVY